MDNTEFLKMSRDEQLVWLNNEVWALKKELALLSDNTIKTELQIPPEAEVNIHKQNNNRVGRGVFSRPILQGEIEEARKQTLSERQASRLLGVCYKTYMKWCKFYGIFIPGGRSKGKGIKKTYKKRLT